MFVKDFLTVVFNEEPETPDVFKTGKEPMNLRDHPTRQQHAWNVPEGLTPRQFQQWAKDCLPPLQVVFMLAMDAEGQVVGGQVFQVRDVGTELPFFPLARGLWP